MSFSNKINAFTGFFPSWPGTIIYHRDTYIDFKKIFDSSSYTYYSTPFDTYNIAHSRIPIVIEDDNKSCYLATNSVGAEIIEFSDDLIGEHMHHIDNNKITAYHSHLPNISVPDELCEVWEKYIASNGGRLVKKLYIACNFALIMSNSPKFDGYI